MKTPAATLTYGIAASPYGQCLIGMQGNKLCYLGFLEAHADAEATLRGAGMTGDFQRDDASAASIATRVFAGKSVDTDAQGTAFQQGVWAELVKIPAGETRSYGDIAQAIGKPKAVRAVGTAIGRNPLAYLVPCHRVVRSDGSLGGYRWGLEVKKRLLLAENASLAKVA